MSEVLSYCTGIHASRIALARTSGVVLLRASRTSKAMLGMRLERDLQEGFCFSHRDIPTFKRVWPAFALSVRS
jgi:hypothetical protein